MRTTTISKKLAAVLVLTSFIGCAELDGYSPGYGGSGYGGSSYNSGYDYDYYRNRDDARQNNRDRREIERERDRLERERERIREEQERQRQNNTWKPPAQEHCPPGFSPSEQKCSSEERRRGCKDIRLNSGLGCVRR
jgi:membrane protein involved in colicin uptake